jgi:hypothetical protein
MAWLEAARTKPASSAPEKPAVLDASRSTKPLPLPLPLPSQSARLSSPCSSICFVWMFKICRRP